MSTRAIAPIVGASQRTVVNDVSNFAHLQDEPLRLARDDRQDMVRVLASEGMSRPAIASTLGVAEKTIQRDFREVGTNVPTSVEGLDGKTYTRRVLASEGMSARAIAPIVGASFKTVSRDLGSVSNDTDARVVESMDGITRTFEPKPEPSAPRAEPIPSQEQI